jgi:transposase
VNANQVFAWRRLYRQGLLEDRDTSGVKLLPVHITASSVSETSPAGELTTDPSGKIHLELPNKALFTVEGKPDSEALRVILECLCQ